MNKLILDYRTPYAAFCVALSVLMVLSVATKVPISVLFAQLASLPIIFSAIVLSPTITAIPLLIAIAGMGALSTKLMVMYGISIAFPALLLGYLTGYSKKFTVKIKSNQKDLPQVAEVIYFHSTSYILSTLALYGIIFAANFVFQFAVPVELLYDKLLPMFTEMETSATLPAPILELLKDTNLRNSFMQAVPIAILILWFCSTVVSYYIAARLAKYFNMLNRPWPNLALEYELSTTTILFSVAAFIGMFLPYPIGYIAEFAAAIFIILWIFAGLCVVHHFVKSFEMPTILLSVFYISLVIFGWLFLFIALLGVLDALFNLRMKLHLKSSL